MDNPQGALLTVEEVAEYLRTTPNTVYRWCRSGKLPARRIAKEWRISLAELEQTLTGHRGAEGRPLAQILARGLRARDHVVAITRSGEEVYDLEIAFFRMALARPGRLFKGCWWQHPDDVRQRFSDGGLPVADLEKEGRLLIADLSAAFRATGIEGAVASWTRVAAEAAATDGGRVWGSGSPDLDSCGGDRRQLLALESTLHKALAKQPAVGICPYHFGEGEFTPDTLSGLAQHHSAVLLYGPGRPVLLR